MTKRGKWLIAGAGSVAVAWSGLQLVLTHRLAATFYDRSVADCARFTVEHPSGHCYPLAPVSAGDWLPYAAASIAVLLALAGTAALIARGGWRWGALVVTALPAANLLGAWQDGRLLGAGWTQLSDDHLTSWIVTGTLVDTAVVTFLAASLVMAIRPDARPTASYAALLRLVPPAVVLAGWWLMRHPLPSRVDEIWLVQAMAFVAAVGLMCTSTLPVAARALGVLVIVPLCTLPVANEAIGSSSMLEVLPRVAFALATAAWVLGAGQLQARNKEGSASSAAMSAMN